MDAVTIINKWHEITNIYSRRKSGKNELYLSDYYIREMDDNIRLALSLDETNVTAIMVIEYFLDEYLKDKEIPLRLIIKNRMIILNLLNYIRNYMNYFTMMK